MTALFEDVIFGPIHSRRLGLSLGVNLLPQHAKICNFDCIYCECGDNNERRGDASQRRFADADRVHEALKSRLITMRDEGNLPDVITFAGNGEPTLHPQFESIIDFTIALRNEFAPSAKISVLSNATMLNNKSLINALKRVDNNILKLDSAILQSAIEINRPVANYNIDSVIEGMKQFSGNLIIQTMFLRGVVNNKTIDNTSQIELHHWLNAIKRINPANVMIYSIDRDTPCSNLQKISKDHLQNIATLVEKLGIPCSVA